MHMNDYYFAGTAIVKIHFSTTEKRESCCGTSHGTKSGWYSERVFVCRSEPDHQSRNENQLAEQPDKYASVVSAVA